MKPQLRLLRGEAKRRWDPDADWWQAACLAFVFAVLVVCGAIWS